MKHVLCIHLPGSGTEKARMTPIRVGLEDEGFFSGENLFRADGLGVKDGSFVFGTGMEINVGAAMKWLREKVAQKTTTADPNPEIALLLLGHSRGAVQTIQIAKAIHQDEMLRGKIKIDMLLIEPAQGAIDKKTDVSLEGVSNIRSFLCLYSSTDLNPAIVQIPPNQFKIDRQKTLCTTQLVPISHEEIEYAFDQKQLTSGNDNLVFLRQLARLFVQATGASAKHIEMDPYAVGFVTNYLADIEGGPTAVWRAARRAVDQFVSTDPIIPVAVYEDPLTDDLILLHEIVATPTKQLLIFARSVGWQATIGDTKPRLKEGYVSAQLKKASLVNAFDARSRPKDTETIIPLRKK